MFEEVSFIKASQQFDPKLKFDEPAPLFRKTFFITDTASAKLSVCGLGYAYYFINGKPVTDDLYTAPVSDYDKILWYNTYDVSHLLRKGKNTIAVIVGNGFFNENFETPWDFHIARWRDNPKFILELSIGGERAVVSDGTWKCTMQSHIVYNEIRSGEIFDDRLFDEHWIDVEYDDSSWQNAVVDENVPRGAFKVCDCEPIREFERFYPVEIIETDEGLLVDFGENISGKVYCTLDEERDTEIIFRHAEEIDGSNRLKLNRLEVLYPDVEFQTDKFISAGRKACYSPTFTYHGFRYVQVSGAKNLKKEDLYAVFIHQAVEQTATFESSSEVLNFIFRAGLRSIYSNMFYALTDCPTREKLGWGNDAMASTETVLILTKSEKFFRKWFEDIKAAMGEDGSMTAVVPSSGEWGRDWGPVADGVLFEVPYQVYRYTGRTDLLQEALPYFYRYVAYMEKSFSSGVDFILGDWGGLNNTGLDKQFVLSIYHIKFWDRIDFAETLLGNLEKAAVAKNRVEDLKNTFIATYLNEDGTVKMNDLSALAMVICLRLYTDFDKVKQQFIELVEKHNYAFHCGMVGVQYLFDALTICGKSDYGVRMLTSGSPGYKDWYEAGATSLWECFDVTSIGSRNHHMFSCVIAWFFKALLGINIRFDSAAKMSIELKPNVACGLSFCRGQVQCGGEVIKVAWERREQEAVYTIEVPQGVDVAYGKQSLTTGKNVIQIHL